MDERHRRAGRRKRLAELIGELRPEEMIVRGIDPEHRRAGVLAEGAEGRDQRRRIADLIGAFRAAAAGEAHRRDEARRRIFRQRDGGEAAGRNADGDHMMRINVGALRQRGEGGREIRGAGAAGVKVIGLVAGPETFRPAAARETIAAPHDGRGGPAAAGEFQHLRQHLLRRELRPLRRIARRAVAQERQRIWPAAGRQHEQPLKPLRARGGLGNVQAFDDVGLGEGGDEGRRN